MSPARRWIAALAASFTVALVCVALALVALHVALLGPANVPRVRLELSYSLALVVGAGVLAASVAAFLRGSRAALPLACASAAANAIALAAAHRGLGGPGDSIGDGAAVVALSVFVLPPAMLWPLGAFQFRKERSPLPLGAWAAPFLLLSAVGGLAACMAVIGRLLLLGFEYVMKVYSRSAVDDLLGSTPMLLALLGLCAGFALLAVAAVRLRRGRPDAARFAFRVGAGGAAWIALWTLGLGIAGKLEPLPTGRYLPVTILFMLLLGAGHLVALAVGMAERGGSR